MTKKTIIVKFKIQTVKPKGNYVRTEDVDTITSLGGEIKHIIDITNTVIVEIDDTKISSLELNPNILWIEEDKEAHIMVETTVVTDEVLEAVDSENIIPWGVNKIRADEVHAMRIKGQNIKGCIIDTGIDYTHPNLKDNYRGGYNFINNTDNPMDDNGHGTHVAGIAAARDTGNGLIGIAPEMNIYAYKVLDNNGSGSYSNIIAAIQKAIDEKMQIINMSLGGSGFSQALKDICDAAYNNNILIVAAAGNSGSGTDTIGYPAKFDSVMSVGATDINDIRASFSSTGPDLEVSAPGVSIPSSVPNGICKLCDVDGYKNLSGTSMATPHVFGEAALIISANSNLDKSQIRFAINNNVIDITPIGKDNWYGLGRVDAKKAVDSIYDNPSPGPTKTYNCSGAPDYTCIEAPQGTIGKYPTLEECQAVCKAPVIPKRYNCINGVCVEDPNGMYSTLELCKAGCKPTPTPNNKYAVRKIGNMGILVLKNMFGTLNADEAISETTKIIREIDSK